MPTALGTVVTGLGLGLRSVNPVLGWGVAGFGLAHVLLGAIDLVDHQPNSNSDLNMVEEPQ